MLVIVDSKARRRLANCVVVRIVSLVVREIVVHWTWGG